jgi:hypothetical protein
VKEINNLDIEEEVQRFFAVVLIGSNPNPLPASDEGEGDRSNSNQAVKGIDQGERRWVESDIIR